MYVVSVPNRNSRPAILLRESYREDGKVKNRTLANLSDWERDRIEALRQVLRGGSSVGLRLEDAFEIIRSRPHGHVAAVLGTLRRLDLDRILSRRSCPERERVVAMIVARIIAPMSKLATARGLDGETLHSTLGEMLGVAGDDEDALYEAMDWLLPLQPRIEEALSRRHLHDGTLALYDLTSTYFEGRTCPLAKLGHNRDGKKGKLQIVFGLLTDGEGRPVAVEVFEGNTSDPKTVVTQIQKLRERFSLKRVILVGDRGMITEARLRDDLKPTAGIEWITALRAPAIKKLVAEGAIQLSFFDQTDLAEITAPAFPGERLVVCKNPLLCEERRRKRQELLKATEQHLDKVVAATQRSKRRLQGTAAIGLRVGKVLGRFKMKKHFRLHIEETGFRYERDEAKIASEAALDGIYVIRTSVEKDVLGSQETVRCYKRLSSVERAFRSLKTVDLHVRPIGHRKTERVRAHVLLCMLAYYVEWHLREALAPMLFDDEDPAAGEALRASVVAPAEPSPSARRKAQTKRTADDSPVHSFQTLLRDLATVTKNRVQPKAKDAPPFDMITRPTALQRRALDLLRVRL